jgi:hypothetical protein
MIISDLLERKTFGLARKIAFTMALVLTLYSLPFSTLRSQNVDAYAGFAKRKISPLDLAVAEKAISSDNDGGRLLAPEEIAGIISRFEQHPKLVFTRRMYIDMMRAHITENEFVTRSSLYDFVTNCNIDKNTLPSLQALNVSEIVVNGTNETTQFADFLVSAQYQRYAKINGYSIWTKKSSPTSNTGHNDLVRVGL